MTEMSVLLFGARTPEGGLIARAFSLAFKEDFSKEKLRGTASLLINFTTSLEV